MAVNGGRIAQRLQTRAQSKRSASYSIWSRFPSGFMLPALIYLLALSFIPMAYALFLSLTDSLLSRQDYHFIGLENYRRLFESSDFYSIVVNTLVFTIGSVLIQVSVGLGLALLLNQPLKGRDVVRSMVLLPWVISGPVVAFIFQWLFSGDRTGIINYMLMLIGLAPIRWLGTEVTAMTTMVLAFAWKNTAFSMVLLLAALQSVPVELQEAAAIDGASARQSFLRITLPLIAAPLMVTAVMVTIQALGEINIPFVLTQGGPGRSTMLLSLMMWEAGFNRYMTGYASGIAAFLFLITMVFVSLYIFVFRTRD